MPTEHPQADVVSGDAESGDRIAVRIVPENIDGVRPVYANHISVQATDDEVFITAAIATPPPSVNPADWGGLLEIEAPVVAQIIISPTMVPRLIGALQVTLNRFAVRLQEPDNTDTPGEGS
jgi:hypothetical protein